MQLPHISAWISHLVWLIVPDQSFQKKNELILFEWSENLIGTALEQHLSTSCHACCVVISLFLWSCE